VEINSTKYTFLFALAVCIVCSLALSLVSKGLEEKRELNIKIDKQKNVLKVVELRDPLDEKATPSQIEETYKDKIQELVIDKEGNVVEGKVVSDIKEGEDFYPLYSYKEGQKTIAYCFPVVGKGLWSTLYGYFSLEPDATTVRGITFYSHGETPGLGAEIEQDWFQNNFKGKSIWDLKKQELYPVAVVKGKVADQKSGDEASHYVDGISGATITSRGVTEMVERELRKYEPFFKKIRKRK